VKLYSLLRDTPGEALVKNAAQHDCPMQPIRTEQTPAKRLKADFRSLPRGAVQSGQTCALKQQNGGNLRVERHDRRDRQVLCAPM
jgi:hypothetical protein